MSLIELGYVAGFVDVGSIETNGNGPYYRMFYVNRMAIDTIGRTGRRII